MPFAVLRRLEDAPILRCAFRQNADFTDTEPNHKRDNHAHVLMINAI
jgi:hypothetical protein